MPALLDRRSARTVVRRFRSTRIPRILCVDDDPDFQTTLEMRLKAYDVEVLHAFHGMQGIAEALDQKPDVIVMDLAMPHGDGEYLLECLKANHITAPIPIIVLTGMRDGSLRRRIVGAGAHSYVYKPIPFDEFVHELSRYIDMRRRSN